MKSSYFSSHSMIRIIYAIGFLLYFSQLSAAQSVSGGSNCEQIRDDAIAKALATSTTDLKIAMNTCMQQLAMCERTLSSAMQKCIDTSASQRRTAEATFVSGMAACTAYSIINPPAGAGCILALCAKLASDQISIQLQLDLCGSNCARDFTTCCDAKTTDFKAASDASLLRFNAAVLQARIEYQACCSRQGKQGK